jgi:hypothetical protein
MEVGMPRPNKTPVQVTLTPDEKRTVDEFRRRQPDLPTRAELIRRLALSVISEQQPANLTWRGLARCE